MGGGLVQKLNFIFDCILVKKHCNKELYTGAAARMEWRAERCGLIKGKIMCSVSKKKFARLSHYLTLCRFTLGRIFVPMSFDPRFFDPVAFEQSVLLKMNTLNCNRVLF